MTVWLRQSTAYTWKAGPFVDDADGVTPETGLTISQADIRLSKNGGNYAQSNNAAGATHDEIGEYDVPLDTTDTNTLGKLKVMIQESGALPVWETFMVVPANVYDSLVGGSDLLEVDPDSIADGVWDEILTGATHNIATSAGRRLRQIAGSIVIDGTGQAGSTSNTIVLDGTASAVDGAYDPAAISIVGGTGAGQTRLIYQYVGATKTAIVDRNWKITPDATSEYIITAHPGREHVNEGLAQGSGGNNLITLNALASSDNDAYTGQLIFIRSGTGDDQVRLVTAYNGATKVATVEKDWDTNPDTTSAYAMLPAHVHSLADYFITDSGQTYGTSVAGSVVQEIADNACTGGGAIGAIEFTYTVTDGAIPVEGADIWITTDIAGSNVIWTGVTNALGIAVALPALTAKPFLDPGTYYFWVQKTGYTPAAYPDTEAVS